MRRLARLLLDPPLPPNAAGFIEDGFAVVELRRKHGGLQLMCSALTPMPPGMLTGSFDQPNIQDWPGLTDIVRRTAEGAGLADRRRWSVSLPEGVIKTVVVALESKPGSRAELDEILNWKVERVVATPVAELRINRQRLSPVGGRERYAVTCSREVVIAEYEALFAAAGWQAGLLMPRHLSEAQWLIWDDAPGDKMLVTGRPGGFTGVVVRNGQPVVVRSHDCDDALRADELHRFALYYRDRLQSEAVETGLLVLGGVDTDEAFRVISEALGTSPRRLYPSDFAVGLEGQPITFEQLAGPAGLASMGWL